MMRMGADRSVLVCKGFYPPLDGNCASRRLTGLIRPEGRQRHVPLGGRGPLLLVGKRTTGARVASSPDSDLEAFSHNPTHGSFAPLAFQPSAMTNCANQRFLSY
ncbi:hypothetical protein VNO78_37179 [Psophocarpus tetragonolobus]|uniref:Uncharacterized protein n=1 Tax=Psophocarpus tetragonolobus TaxID=3891 RepID=A0AAN9NCV0_PSOTE